MLPIRALLFDFDWVIAHTAPIVKRALWSFFREKEIAVLEKDFEEDGYATKSLEQVCGVIQDKYSITIDANSLRSQIWQTQLELMNEGLVFDPELLVLLEFCQQKNIALWVGSNSIWSRIQWITEKMKVDHYFQTIVWAHDVAHHKPDPEVWIQCAHNLDILYSSCLVIDDGLPGLLGAQKCGMQSVYYHRYSSPEVDCISIADYHTDSFADIIKILSGN
jgi:HAD superfamily hydrolase (TIGR01509 family)